jgi:hypothetical protein
MFDVFAQCATDPELEVKGVWRDVGGGTRLLIARSNNRAYSKLLNSLFEKHQQALDIEGPESEKLSDEIMVQVFGKTILLGWEKLGYKGVELPYSEENAKMVLAHADFRVKVGRLSAEIDGYKMKVEAEQGKA